MNVGPMSFHAVEMHGDDQQSVIQSWLSVDPEADFRRDERFFLRDVEFKFSWDMPTKIHQLSIANDFSYLVVGVYSHGVVFEKNSTRVAATKNQTSGFRIL